jgi:hypothetical protein
MGPNRGPKRCRSGTMIVGMPTKSKSAANIVLPGLARITSDGFLMEPVCHKKIREANSGGPLACLIFRMILNPLRESRPCWSRIRIAIALNCFEQPRVVRTDTALFVASLQATTKFLPGNRSNPKLLHAGIV